jgi:hypothetical protein
VHREGFSEGDTRETDRRPGLRTGHDGLDDHMTDAETNLHAREQAQVQGCRTEIFIRVMSVFDIADIDP